MGLQARPKAPRPVDVHGRTSMIQPKTWLPKTRRRPPSTYAFCWIALLAFAVSMRVYGPWKRARVDASGGGQEGVLAAANGGGPRDRLESASSATAAQPTPPPPSATTTTTSHSPPRATPTPKACLAMIIKNEGPLLPRLFQSVRGFVSEYCIVDTGSTDNTLDVLKSLNNTTLPGIVVEEPFVNFATTRNFMLETCWRKTDCDYLVLLDADMVLRVSPEWDWTHIDHKVDVYNMIQVSGIEYYNVRMLSRATAHQVKVVGATHEYYDVPRHFSHKLLPKNLVYIEDMGDGNAKDDKFERDERLLRAEVERDPNNTRAVFYLANTLKDQDKYAEAITFYERRAVMGGWHADVDYSVYMLSRCYMGLEGDGGNVDKARYYAEVAAFRKGYERAEPLYHLATYLHARDDYKRAWCYATRAKRMRKPDTSKALFIELAIYDYWIEYERASLCSLALEEEEDEKEGSKNTNKDSSSKLYCQKLARDFVLQNKDAPQSMRDYLIEELRERGEEVVLWGGVKDDGPGEGRRLVEDLPSSVVDYFERSACEGVDRLGAEMML